ITEDLTTDLSRIDGSFVISRGTAFTYKGKNVDVRQIGKELGVRYVLEGSVARSADQVRINAQLIDAETGAHVWADRFDGPRDRLADLQDQVTGRLARSLNLKILEAEGRRIALAKQAFPEAADLVMRGRAIFYGTNATFNANRSALDLFESALRVDPQS